MTQLILFLADGSDNIVLARLPSTSCLKILVFCQLLDFLGLTEASWNCPSLCLIDFLSYLASYSIFLPFQFVELILRYDKLAWMAEDWMSLFLCLRQTERTFELLRKMQTIRYFLNWWNSKLFSRRPKNKWTKFWLRHSICWIIMGTVYMFLQKGFLEPS